MAAEPENSQGEERKTDMLAFLRHGWLHIYEAIYPKIVRWLGKPLSLFRIGRLRLGIDLEIIHHARDAFGAAGNLFSDSLVIFGRDVAG
jgi:hypothetical protein